MALPSFSEQLAFGQIAESQIAQWLRRVHGCAILPVYEKEIATGKGPRFFAPDTEIVAPDMLVLKHDKVFWVEAKHKGVFSWHRLSGRWVTGIDLHHYQQYLALAEGYPYPVWLLFLHERDSAVERRPHEPWPCPTGLYGGELRALAARENHRSDEWGRHGMVYWAHDQLRQYATLAEIRALQGAA